MASSMMESLICVAGSPWDMTSSGGPGSDRSSRDATLGGDSSESASAGGSGGLLRSVT